MLHRSQINTIVVGRSSVCLARSGRKSFFVLNQAHLFLLLSFFSNTFLFFPLSINPDGAHKVPKKSTPSQLNGKGLLVKHQSRLKGGSAIPVLTDICLCCSELSALYFFALAVRGIQDKGTSEERNFSKNRTSAFRFLQSISFELSPAVCRCPQYTHSSQRLIQFKTRICIDGILKLIREHFSSQT